MFKYVSDISDLSHSIIENHLEKKIIAIDATLGNGYDTDFLCERFEKVYSFDVQEEACLNYKLKNRKNVSVVNDSHHKFDEYVIEDKVNCIMYNLGFLPGSNKEITTLAKTTMKSIEAGLEILDSNGIMTIAIYRGHSEGKNEENFIMEYVRNLPKNIYGVMLHEYLNRAKSAPLLIVIEKKWNWYYIEK